MKKRKQLNLIPYLFIILIIVFILITVYIRRNFTFPLAETQIFLTNNKFLQIMSLFSREQVRAYLLLATTLDVVWPIAYNLFFYALNIKTMKNRKIKKYISFYILFIFLIDMLENYLTANFLLTNNSKLISICVLSTNIKWIAIFIISLISIINCYKFIKKQSFKDLIHN